jgi:phosphatidylserine/phosphatidylglycerophosphate/cardiolipin synthase-like enzyme
MNHKDRIIFDIEHYDIIMRNVIPKTKKCLWIATANLKNLYTDTGDGWEPYLAVLTDLIKRGVRIRIIHSGKPSESFQRALANISRKQEIFFFACQRNHQKIIIRDDEFAYTGSANFTGAAVGSKKDDRRNFEAGLITTDRRAILLLQKKLTDIIEGKYCKNCYYRDDCPGSISGY